MKKLLQDAWRAVTGNRSGSSHPYRGTDVDSAPPPVAESAAVDAAFDAALAVHQSGRLSEAQAAYARILEQAPDHVQALHFLGVSHGQTGDLALAERLIRQSIVLHALPEYFSNLAMMLDRQGRRDEAIVAACEAEQRAPGNATPCAALGNLLSAAGRQAEAEQAYRRALQLQPEDADLWFRLGTVLAGLQRNAEAVAAYHKTLSLQPTHADACNNLGNLLAGMGRRYEAEVAYRQSLAMQPGAAAVHCNLGRLLQQDGRHAEAEGAYRRALELQSGFAEAHNNLGTLLKNMGRTAEAETAYRQALAAQPEFAQAWANLGLLLEEAGQFAEAEAVQRRVLFLTPDSAAAHFNLANVYGKTDRNTEAEAAYRRALELDPEYAVAFCNLAALLQGGDRLGEAETLFRRALVLDPFSSAAHYNLGGLLLDTGRHAEAETHFDRARALRPELADVHNRLGTLYKETGRPVAAEAAYRRALALQPDSVGTLTNLALLLHETERFAEAEAAYRQALNLDPGHDFARYNFGLFCLAQGRFKEGWEGYERRWKMKGFNALRHQAPQMPWRGEPLSGESMVVWQEQGVGDVILYAGLIPDLLGLGPRLVVECEARLVPLLARSFPQARVVMRSDRVHPATLEARWQSPLGSLCCRLRARPEDFTWRGPYLVPDVTRVAELRKRYRGSDDKPVVGISWRSSNYKVGVRKSLPLSAWAPLLKYPGVTFVNLQYGDCTDELAQLERDHGVSVQQDDTVDAMQDLDGFAAQVAAMDLVISTSNSTAHFAGALGVPAWTLLPRGDALLWYWFHETERSPWYPGMRLFRQDCPGDWSGPLARIQAALPAFIAEHRQSRAAIPDTRAAP